ncbi:MAG: ABC transporter permease [Pseudomonadota bacterium]|nr:ABC transporter permease [Pseudomonadota bacterium]
MRKYILKRIILIIPTVLGVGVLVFFLMRVIPGDTCLFKWVDFGTDLDPALLEICRNETGLNDPIYIQFFDFVIGVLTLNFGISMWTGQPITEEISLRFGLSLQVAIMATTLSILIGIPMGIISAVKQDTWIDYLVRSLSIGGVAIPSFWLGILIILGLLIFSQAWIGEPWMPPILYVSPFVDPMANLSQLIWPVIATGYRYASVVARMTRSAFLEILREDYIRTARAKGLKEIIIMNPHALRNALLPIVTVIGMEFSFFMGGLVVTEQVFNLNGLGSLLVDSVLHSDYNMIQALAMLIAVVFVGVNLIIDLAYAWIDPRIRYGKQ